MKQKVWFITGASRGFGKIWAEAALQRGDKVVATVRQLSTLQKLKDQFGDSVLTLELDVTSRKDCFDAVQKAKDHFGQLDVVINNAGYGQFGMIEEISEEEARQQMETNFFGALWVTQAALPIMREQGSGHILQVSSIGGILAFENIGLYNASKWALEAFTESLSKEVAGFGIHVILIEPGGFKTDWAGDSAKHSQAIPAYDKVREQRARFRGAMKQGDPNATADAILQVVDAEKPPLRIFLGEQPIEWATEQYQKRLENWQQWQPVSLKAQGTN